MRNCPEIKYGPGTGNGFHPMDDVSNNMYDEQRRSDAMEAEQAAQERFLDFYSDNNEFQELIQQQFFDDQDLWMIKEYGCDDDESLHDHCFEQLYQFDHELLWDKPIECIKAYMKSNNLNDVLRLVEAFKKEKPVTFFDAYALGVKMGVMKKEVINQAVEVYCAGREFKGGLNE